MELGIKGKTALVTGASAGLGFAAAMSLAEEGVRVAINSRSIENLEGAAKKIKRKTGDYPVIIEGDLTVEGTAEEIVARTVEKLGAVDILVSNAGGPPAGKFLEHAKEAWRASANLTLYSAIDLAREVIPNMIEKKWGRIIFITSVAVKQPVENLIISNALRAGVTGFAKSISNELASYGITVNSVCPGYTETERLKELARYQSETTGRSVDEIYGDWKINIPAGRLGTPGELASLIAFLASDRASYITGTSISVDGGLAKGLL
jgi:3-oxoacyl-[acyl-carrier protein] reductase